MIVYLDMCCLKRPFDDQSDARIGVETAAVLAILRAIADGRLSAVRSVAHNLENSRNPDQNRAKAVSVWLEQLNPLLTTPSAVSERVHEFVRVGLRSLDAYHLAWAEHLGAEVFLTCDDRLLSKCLGIRDKLNIQVRNPTDFAAQAFES